MWDGGFGSAIKGEGDPRTLLGLWRVTPRWIKWLAVSPVGAEISLAAILLCCVRAGTLLAFGDIARAETWMAAGLWAIIAFGSTKILVMLCRINRRLRTFGLGADA
jgi:hypothetical protein